MFWARPMGEPGRASRESAGGGTLRGCRTVRASGDAQWEGSEATEVAAKGLDALSEFLKFSDAGLTSRRHGQGRCVAVTVPIGCALSA